MGVREKAAGRLVKLEPGAKISQFGRSTRNRLNTIRWRRQAREKAEAEGKTPEPATSVVKKQPVAQTGAPKPPMSKWWRRYLENQERQKEEKAMAASRSGEEPYLREWLERERKAGK